MRTFRLDPAVWNLGHSREWLSLIRCQAKPASVITLLSGIIKKQDRIPESALEQARRFKADLEAIAKQPKNVRKA